MKVAVMFSGGKDSTYALHECLQRGWQVEALIAVKPKNTEAYLYHYATVEWTLLSSEALGIPLILLQTKKIGPEEEAKALEKVFKKIKIDALILGGVGLQKTQIESIEAVAQKSGIDIIVPHKNYTSEELLTAEIESGFKIMVTDVATDGLGDEWLGRILDEKSLAELKSRAKKFGFDPLGEGGSWNSFVVDGPIFKKKINFVESQKIWDTKTSSGYLEVKSATLVEKN